MFTQFITDRLLKSSQDPEILIFDEFIKLKLNRSRLKLVKQDTPFLNDSSFSISQTIWATPPNDIPGDRCKLSFFPALCYLQGLNFFLFRRAISDTFILNRLEDIYTSYTLFFKFVYSLPNLLKTPKIVICMIDPMKKCGPVHAHNDLLLAMIGAQRAFILKRICAI